MSETFLGKDTRFKKSPSKSLVNSAFAYELECSEFVLKWLSVADMAHVATLAKDNVIKPDVASQLLNGLYELHEESQNIPLNPAVGDSYNNRDKFLEDKLGSLTGYIHIGRARREASTIAWLLCCREKLLHLHELMVELCEAMSRVIELHKTTYMVDYTYLQHAQPTTLAHYLQGFQMPLVRDLDRVKQAIASINLSPACSGSVNGSQIYMDREYAADLMGFAGLLHHTRDAMWSPDICLDTILPINSIMTTLNRMSEEFIIWNSAEFNFLSLDDSHTRTSVIMPQKKNPYGLAHIRGQARILNGVTASLLSTNQTISGQPDNRLYAYGELPKAIDYASQCVELFSDIISSCEFNTDELAKAANDKFAVATDICDMLVKTQEIDNRSVHKVVGRAVRNALENNIDHLSISGIKQAAEELTITLSDIDEKLFAANTDVPQLIKLRKGIGSAHPDQVAKMQAQNADKIKAAISFKRALDLESFEQDFLASIKSLLDEL